MGLMYATGPLSRKPAGTFNFDPPPPGQALYIETSPKRVRVYAGGEVVADSRAPVLLQESGHQPIYYFPPRDVRTDLLEDSDRKTRCPKKGEASYYTIRVGDHVVDAAAWYYPDPLPSAAPLKDLIAFYWNRMDRWVEEEEEVFVHPRDPYHRIDLLSTARHVKVSLEGELLAETERALALFESNLPTRWYIPREDVRAELEPSDTITRCPYKGQASYYSARVDGELVKDLIWYYPEPITDAARIKGLLCFFNEKVDLELDRELEIRPGSAWTHGVKSEAAELRPARAGA